MNENQTFFKDGFVLRQFNDTQDFHRFRNLLKEMRGGNLREGFSWTRGGYKNAKDLSGMLYEYDEVFVRILFDQNIPQILKNITGLDLFLAFVKTRINLPGNPYTGWHRDTSYMKTKTGEVKGNLPPLINLNYYPSFGSPPEENALKIWPGTHNFMHKSRLLDFLYVHTKKPVYIPCADSGYLIFDTGTLHDVCPSLNNLGSIRVIYNFCQEFQLPLFANKYKKLHNLYQKGLDSSLSLRQQNNHTT